MYDIIIGRSKSDSERLGTKGAIFLGKHYVKMGRTLSLSNKVFLDLLTTHVIFVCGKRGGGKSYTMGVIAEGLSDLPLSIRKNLSIILLDTMGIYWTMKYPNIDDKALLKSWGLEPKALNPIIFTPKGFFDKFKKEGIPSDKPFSLKPSELTGSDWVQAFKLDDSSYEAVLIELVINKLKEDKKDFDLDDIINIIKEENFEEKTKIKTINLFSNAKNWGLFDKEGTAINELVVPGQITVLDVSCYVGLENSWNIKSLVIGLTSQKLFNQRMKSRRKEEFTLLKEKVSLIEENNNSEPLVWLVIDEAHEFLPKDYKTLASDALITILREGRQPGISLVLASQQPGKIHTDVMTQSDIIISHRITAKIDTDALGLLMQNYMRQGLDKELDNLPRKKGAALIIDDNNEKLFPIQIRPRFTWHGGSSPKALKEKKEIFSFLEDI